MIFEFIKRNSNEFKIEKMVKIFRVSRAGYYRYINKKESLRSKNTKQLTEQIKIIYAESRNTYGSPRICASINKNGYKCSRKKVAKIMQQNNIRAKTIKRRMHYKNVHDYMKNVKPNIVNQNFSVTIENTVWATDITYIKTAEGWLYLSAILDLFSRKVVGLSMGSQIDTNLVIRSLQQAICHRKPSEGLILHSDRGTQYTSRDYQEFVTKHGIISSMSAAGCCYDNAVMESFFHTLKTEHSSFCNFKTRHCAISSIFEYVEVFYNRQRIHSTLNYLSPVEYENQCLTLV